MASSPDCISTITGSCDPDARFMVEAPALERLLKRDRAVVVTALAVITALAWADLAWLANDMAMGGMDMMGFRMIPAGRGWMMPASEPWKSFEFGYMFAMWFVMMIGMMTPSAAPMILIYARVGRHAAAQGKQIRRKRLVRRRLSCRLGHIFALCDGGSMGAGTRRAADAYDGERQQSRGRRRPDHRRALSALAAQEYLPSALPHAHVVPFAPLASGHPGCPPTRRNARHLLHRLLLGVDGVAFRRWRHEFVMDRRAGHSGADRESAPAWANGSAAASASP